MNENEDSRPAGPYAGGARYNKTGDVLKAKYGTKVYKLALSSGATCPNRDGKCGTGGCLFCSPAGSGDFAESGGGSVTEAIDRAAALLKNKLKGCPAPLFIPYFQDFSATYAPLAVQRERFTEAISHPLAAELSVATRPDCLPDEVIELLAGLARLKPVTVELGLQTRDDCVAAFMNRGYPSNLFPEAVAKLKAAGIQTVGHMIVGLPCPPQYGSSPDGFPLRTQSRDEILDTANFITASGADGIKIHLLHVLEGTPLAEMYKKGLFRTLSLEEYAGLVCDIIEILPEETVVHRITGDAPKSILLSPRWSAGKKKVLNFINREMERRGVVQGSRRRELMNVQE
ncbi:MAG: TIGR01212 family radical SAM protein [Clostridia bacterium]|nr:TIGR01212 family radical SAM protein [Clostridia bacterium]